jgi:hypothetical protein
MSVEHVEVLVEEPSMEAALRVLLPRMMGALSFEIYRYDCKDALLARLPDRLRGYASWLPEAWRILVVVDRDDDDCGRLKERLERAARDAGFSRRRAKGSVGPKVINRIAIEELEAWYFGDWEAVRLAYPRAPVDVTRKLKYRDPDAIPATWEALERLLQGAGYFSSGLRKIELARAVAEHMDPARNTSASFGALRESLESLAGHAP